MRLLTTGALGYALLVVLGLLAESAFVWLRRRRRRDEEGRRPDRRRIPCNLVEIEVDSYEFHDEIGKGFNPDAAFTGRAPVWPARVEPARFLFATGEVYRDVELLVDAPEGPGPAGVFNVDVRQGGVASGGVTITIIRGG